MKCDFKVKKQLCGSESPLVMAPFISMMGNYCQFFTKSLSFEPYLKELIILSSVLVVCIIFFIFFLIKAQLSLLGIHSCDY